MKHSNDWYSHPTRAFHLSILLDTIEEDEHKPPDTSTSSGSGTFRHLGSNSCFHPNKAQRVRCVDLTSKLEGSVYRPFANWVIVHGGRQIPRWKRHRFGSMTRLWQASQFAHALRAEHPASAASPTLNQPERHLVDAQFLFGNRTLHLVALICKEDEPRQLGDRSHNFVVEGSFFFLECVVSLDMVQ